MRAGGSEGGREGVRAIEVMMMTMMGCTWQYSF